MTESILPQPVDLMEIPESQKIDSTSFKHKSNRTLMYLVGIILIAFLGLIASVVYDYLNTNSQDSIRRSDLAYIATQAETFYNLNHYYPSLRQINSVSFSAFNPKGLDKTKFKDPTSKTEVLVSSVSPSAYAYEPTPANCNNFKIICQHFKLVAVMSSNQDYVQKSRH